MASKKHDVDMDDSDSEGNDDWTPSDMELKPQATMARSIGRPEQIRARRAPATPPEQPKRAIRLNVKPPSRLRQVTNEDDEESVEAAPASRASLSRSSKTAKPPLIDKPSESEDEDEEEDENADGSMEESDDDAEGDEDEDADMSDGSPPPAIMPAPAQITTTSKTKIKLNNPYASAASRPSPSQVLKQNGKVESVEQKEIRMAGTGRDSDDDLSSIASDDANEGVRQDAEGDVDSAEDLDGLEGDSDDAIRASQIGSDDLDSDDSGSPDPSKLTRRQRRTSPSGLLALSNEAQKKKFFTAEQITMRRSEMARRRKDLSEKRNEQEKLDTLDRLLHKRAPVRRSRKEMEEAREREQFGTPGIGADSGDEGGVRPRAGYVRTIMDARGTRVGVPEEWLGSAAGEVFMGVKREDRGLRPVNSVDDGRPRMVQEVA